MLREGPLPPSRPLPAPPALPPRPAQVVGPQPDAPPSSALCIHCGAAVRAPARFCCAGCEAVHHALAEAGLGESYYRLRAVDPRAQAEARPAAPALDADFGYLDTEAFRAAHAHPAPGRPDTVACSLYLAGLTCAACVWLVESLAQRAPGMASARADLTSGRLDLVLGPGASLASLARDLARFGYRAGLTAHGEAERDRRRQDLFDLALAGAIAMNVMILTLPYYLGLGEGALAALFGWVSFGLVTVSLAGSGRRFFVNAYEATRRRLASLDAPIALGLLAGWVGALWHLALGAYEHLYLDSLAVLVFALLAGRFVQARAVERALSRARALEASVPRLVRVLREGAWREVAPETVAAGEALRLEAGEATPCRARVEEEHALFDLQVLSGEEAPRALARGAEVPAGARLVQGSCALRALEAGAARPLESAAASGLLAAADALGAPARRAPGLADRLASGFVAAVIALALAGFIGWLYADGLDAALRAAMAVLIVACPCALGLATPAVGALVVGRAASAGVLVRDPQVVERLGRIRTVILDKTGTLTEGRPELARLVRLGERAEAERARRALAAIERASAHPIARTLARALEHAGDPAVVLAREVETLAGEGIRGVVDDLEVLALGPRALAARGIALASEAARALADTEAAGESAVVVLARAAPALAAAAAVGLAGGAGEGEGEGDARDDEPWSARLVLGLRDALRPGARASVEALRARGMRVLLLSGDGRLAVERVAERLGLDDARGEHTPSEKLDVIEALQREGPVAMVGDGLNDVAALRGASIAVTLGHAAPGALVASEVILSAEAGLAGLTALLTLADRARRVIARGVVFAIAYNALGVALALAGAITPLIAALLMPASSLTVVAHAIASMRRR